MAGARTPEELETLLEDAFVLRDREAVGQLFEPDAVLAGTDSPHQARGREQVERFVAQMWNLGRGYVAEPGKVLQVRDTALILSGRATTVVRRGDDG